MIKFTAVLIEGYPMLMGEPPIIDQEKFGLKIGDPIIQIGRNTPNGRESTSCRIKRFHPPITYSGIMKDGDINYLAFKLPRGGVSGFNLFCPEQPIYSLWRVVEVEGYEPELILDDYNSNSPEIYKADFK